MKGRTIKELFSEGTFKYNNKKSPATNYRLFQQAISFERGVEFLSSSNEHKGPVIYLVNVPGLSVDLKKTKAILERFNKDLMNHLENEILNKKYSYKVFEIYYNLFSAVNEQQQEYSLGKEKYFGVATVKEFAYKELKQFKLPIIRSNYRGTFLNIMSGPSEPVGFKELGSEMKKCLSSLYILKRRYNMQLITKLEEYKRVLFNKNNMIGKYHYKGEIADVIEIALALNETNKLLPVGDAKLDLNKFCNDFCKFLGIPFTKLSNHLPTISNRKTQRKLFLNEAKKSLIESSNL